MNIKQFFEKQVQENPFQVFELAKKLLELEGIERQLNVVYGIELEIKVKPAKRQEGHFLGKGVIDFMDQEK